MTAAAELHVSKLAAAQRQLDAAIRMYFGEEDELAIHTVVSAAYSIISDLKSKRGRDESVDFLMRGIFMRVAISLLAKCLRLSCVERDYGNTSSLSLRFLTRMQI